MPKGRSSVGREIWRAGADMAAVVVSRGCSAWTVGLRKTIWWFNRVSKLTAYDFAGPVNYVGGACGKREQRSETNV